MSLTENATENGYGRGRTPTQRSHTAEVEAVAEAEAAQHQQHHQHQYVSDNGKPLPNFVYIVTDTCYPSASNFDTNIGTTSVISAHSSKAQANARAKKVIYENDGGCTVDIDKIIEEVKQGLYTGIGVGGKEEKEGCCFARKCEVEAKMVDEDSEDEGSGESVEFGAGEEEREGRGRTRNGRDMVGDNGTNGDVDMG